MGPHEYGEIELVELRELARRGKVLDLDRPEEMRAAARLRSVGARFAARSPGRVTRMPRPSSASETKNFFRTLTAQLACPAAFAERLWCAGIVLDVATDHAPAIARGDQRPQPEAFGSQVRISRER